MLAVCTNRHGLILWLYDGTEIRDLGVGYFGFSTDPLERQRQMDELKRLREQVWQGSDGA